MSFIFQKATNKIENEAPWKLKRTVLCQRGHGVHKRGDKTVVYSQIWHKKVIKSEGKRGSGNSSGLK